MSDTSFGRNSSAPTGVAGAGVTNYECNALPPSSIWRIDSRCCSSGSYRIPATFSSSRGVLVRHEHHNRYLLPSEKRQGNAASRGMAHTIPV